MADYSKYDKAELLKIIAKQEKELKAKKYGLVWDSEREPEQVVLDCENNLPILKRVKSKEIRTDDSEDNILIEGDNYHALTVLNYTHKEKIDVIYIDPPYNTGAKDWKYNNNYVEKDDGFRHSKWLNMMEKRLKLGKNLLNRDGIMITAIDDNEFATMKLLLNSIMPMYSHETIVVNHHPQGSGGLNVSATHEYAIVSVPNGKHLFLGNYIKERIEQWSLIKAGAGEDYYRIGRPKMFFAIHIDKNTGQAIDIGKELSVNDSYDLNDTKEGYKRIYPFDSNGGERRWRYGRETMLQLIEKQRIIASLPNYSMKVIVLREGSFKPMYSNWIDSKYNAGPHGTKLLKDILPNSNFPFPKSLYTVFDFIVGATRLKKDALTLDFFAGSGTTAHAVLELNKEDDGNRKFILCTNNENHICTDVTYPRIHNVIKGYEFKGKDKTTLFEKKLTWTAFNKKSNEIVEQINEIIEENKNSYDKIEKEFKDNTIKIIGIKDIDGNKEGLNGNLQYFKTGLIKKTKNRDQVKINLTKKCTEMLCVKENIFNLEIEEKDYKIFSSNKTDKYLCVYYNLIEDTFDEFLTEIKKLKGKKIIYMFSMENEIDKNLFTGIKNLTIEAIPQNILDVYRQLVKMNIPVKTNVIFTDLNKAKIKVFTDKDKDDGARVLRIVLEKVIQKISQDNSINILNAKGKEEKISKLNDNLLNQNIIAKIEWAENRTFLTIGNNAAHGDYDDYDLKQVEKFYKHIQSLLNNYNV